MKIHCATSNPGKLREFQLAASYPHADAWRFNAATEPRPSGSPDFERELIEVQRKVERA